MFEHWKINLTDGNFTLFVTNHQAPIVALVEQINSFIAFYTTEVDAPVGIVSIELAGIDTDDSPDLYA